MSKMPTELKKRSQPADKVVVMSLEEFESFKTIAKQHQELCDTLQQYMDMYNEQSDYIKALEEQNCLLREIAEKSGVLDTDDSVADDFKHEEGVFKARFIPGKGFEVAKPERKAKFKGVHMELDPFKGNFNIAARYERE